MQDQDNSDVNAQNPNWQGANYSLPSTASQGQKMLFKSKPPKVADVAGDL
jgi:hypothetical protein